MKIYLQRLRWKTVLLLKRCKYRLGEILAVSYKDRRIGSCVYIDPTVHVLRWRGVTIGDDSVLCEDIVINVNEVPGSYGLEIGRKCWIGRRAFINVGGGVRFGDFSLVGPNCSFLGADHNFDSPFKPYVDTGSKDKGKIVLQSNVWLGANVTVLGGVTVGFGSIVAAGSMVTRSIPPLSIALGSPAKVIKRYNILERAWEEASAENDSIDFSLNGLSEEVYTKMIGEADSGRPLPYRAAGKAMYDIIK